MILFLAILDSFLIALATSFNPESIIFLGATFIVQINIIDSFKKLKS